MDQETRVLPVNNSLQCRDLRVDHTVNVQFAAAGEGVVLGGVGEGFWVGGVFEG